MLLLVIHPKLNHLQRLRREVRQCAVERFIDVRAIGADLVERRPAQHPATGAGVARPLGLVIAVEQKGVALVERRVAEHVVAQHERLEEPGGVGEVPFRRRGVGERLNRGVGVAERRGEVERQPAGSE